MHHRYCPLERRKGRISSGIEIRIKFNVFIIWRLKNKILIQVNFIIKTKEIIIKTIKGKIKFLKIFLFFYQFYISFFIPCFLVIWFFLCVVGFNDVYCFRQFNLMYFIFCSSSNLSPKNDFYFPFVTFFLRLWIINVVIFVPFQFKCIFLLCSFLLVCVVIIGSNKQTKISISLEHKK